MKKYLKVEKEAVVHSGNTDSLICQRRDCFVPRNDA